MADVIEGVTEAQLAWLRDVAERGHANAYDEVLTALRVALRFYDLTFKAWQGCRAEHDERVAELKQVAEAITADGVYERQRFIREAFIAYVTRGLEIDTAWERAKAAWELKPEDC